MNLIEFNNLTECRRLLDNIRPNCQGQAESLKRAKGILDDILEFQIFPDLPGLEDN